MLERLEVLEARVDEAQVDLAQAQDEWDRRVREGDDDPENLLFVAGEVVKVKAEIRELRADLARAAILADRIAEKGGDN
jgi:hypothetical protein